MLAASLSRPLLRARPLAAAVAPAASALLCHAAPGARRSMSLLSAFQYAIWRKRPTPSVLRGLEGIANLKPRDGGGVEELYLEALLSAGMPREVVSRVESGHFAVSWEVLELYARAVLALQGLPEHALPPLQASLRALWQHSARSGQQALQPGDLRAAVQAGLSGVGSGGGGGGAYGYGGGGGGGGGPALAAAGGGGGPFAQGLGTRMNPVIVESHRRGSFWGALASLVPYAILAYVGYSMMNGMQGMKGFNPLGGSDIAEEVSSVPDTRFEDVKGADEAKHELQDVVNFLRNPKRYQRLGAKVPAGVLLTGPPGTGKTLLARAVAGEAGCKFYAKSASEFEEMLVGLGARRVRDLFAAAKRNAPAIIFIDEIDALGGKRRGGAGGSGTDRQTLNQLLACLDGFSKNEGVIVIAATNTPDFLDPALIRPGRFDSAVDVPLPDVKGRREILDLYLARCVVEEGVSSELLSRATPGFSGAQLEALVNSAALMAAARGSDCVEAGDLEEARDKLIMGPSKLSRVRNAEQQRLTAFHEGGHTLVSMLTPGTAPLHKVTILPRGNSGGATFMLPRDNALRTRASILAEIDVSMGGRAAEELVYGVEQVTSGASGDMQGASSLARAYCAAFAMSEVGMASFGEPGGGGGGWGASPERHALLDAEVEKILKASYSRTKALLEKNRASLDRLAAALVRKGGGGTGRFLGRAMPPLLRALQLTRTHTPPPPPRPLLFAPSARSWSTRRSAQRSARWPSRGCPSPARLRPCPPAPAARRRQRSRSAPRPRLAGSAWRPAAPLRPRRQWQWPARTSEARGERYCTGQHCVKKNSGECQACRVPVAPQPLVAPRPAVSEAAGLHRLQ